MDLADMKEWSDQNDGYKYILTCVDCFSRYGWAVPVKSKDKKEVWNAFAKIMKTSHRKPSWIWTDEGGEFYSGYWDQELNKAGIGHYSTFTSDHKASMVERFNRTLKKLMWSKLAEHEDDNEWIRILPTILNEYNHSFHLGIGMTPTQASDPIHEKTLWKEQYEGYAIPPMGKPKYKIGDIVRIPVYKTKFHRGYKASWSKDLFIIKTISPTKPVLYYLKDAHGEEVKGGFYESQILKSSADFHQYHEKQSNTPTIEKVVGFQENKNVKWKYKRFLLNVILSNGNEEQVPLSDYVGKYVNGVFQKTPDDPDTILEPIKTFVMKNKELKKLVYEKVYPK